MTLRYKLQKFRDKWNDGYFKPKFTNPDSVERPRAKKDIEEGLNEHLYLNDKELLNDLLWEQEMEQYSKCYAMELADPNYRCTCFEVDDE